MSFFFIVHVVVCILLIAVILFQEGKAGGLTSVSESGQSMFGARGAASFLTKLTSGLAIAFMTTSLFLNFTSGDPKKSIASDYTPKTEESRPDAGTLTAPTESGDAAATETTEAPPADAEAGTPAGEEAPPADAPAEENNDNDQ